MEKKIKVLFDFQRFQGNPRLEKMINDAQENGCTAISDDALSNVAAAGEIKPDVNLEE